VSDVNNGHLSQSIEERKMKKCLIYMKECYLSR